jgi:hypothetical protein
MSPGLDEACHADHSIYTRLGVRFLFLVTNIKLYDFIYPVRLYYHRLTYG